MSSLFTCPICAAPLTRGERTYTCPNGHCYDIAKEGYVNLLPANKKHSADPGDDKTMVSARTQFLEGGWYGPLRQTLCELTLSHTGDAPVILDAGCGEGWYTGGIRNALDDAGRTPTLAGIDLSRSALKKAARRERAAEWAVASVYHLPVGDAAADLVVCCFSPMAAEEYARVLRPAGTLLYVVPGPDHLWEMKEVLYDEPYRNPEEVVDYPGFALEEVVPVDCPFTLTKNEDVMALFAMTPYAWKSPKEGVERLAALDALAVTGQFRVHVFRKD